MREPRSSNSFTYLYTACPRPADERLRPPEQLADSVVRLEARPARGSLQLTVDGGTDTEAPGRLTGTEAPSLPVSLEHGGEHRHGSNLAPPAAKRITREGAKKARLSPSAWGLTKPGVRLERLR
jgi:hypothetical protein